MELPDHVTSVTSLSGSHEPNYVIAQLVWGRNFTTSDVNTYKCIANNSATVSESRDVILTIGMLLPCM